MTLFDGLGRQKLHGLLHNMKSGQEETKTAFVSYSSQPLDIVRVNAIPWRTKAYRITKSKISQIIKLNHERSLSFLQNILLTSRRIERTRNTGCSINADTSPTRSSARKRNKAIRDKVISLLRSYSAMSEMVLERNTNFFSSEKLATICMHCPIK